MSFELIIFILWVVAGVLTIMNNEVPKINYILLWICYLIKLAKEL